MKKLILTSGVKNLKWEVSILTVALCLLLSINVNAKTVSAPTSLLEVSGSLTGSVTNSSAKVDLTAEGTSDWIHFGSTVDRKSEGKSQISNYTIVGSGVVHSYDHDPRQMSWSDGTPIISATNNVSGMYNDTGIGSGFSLTAPADTYSRTLNVYVGGYGSSGTLTATLSDGSAAAYTNTTSLISGAYNRNYSLTYKAASAGQNLTVVWKMTSGTVSVTLNGSALSGGNTLLASVSIAITTGTNPMIPGSSVTFTATPVNGGTTPSYQWKVDGVDFGTDSPIFTASAMTNLQAVTCVMTSDLSEATGNPATSKSITMIVNPTASNEVNVMEVGAKGDGVTDDTQAIQTAVDIIAGTGGTVLVPNGTYLVAANSYQPHPAINLGSNMTFKMDSGAVIKLKPNAYDPYIILYVNNISDVNIVGGTLQGERHQHLLPGDYAWSAPNQNGEYGFGIWVLSSHNIYIQNVTAKECWGDGFMIGEGDVSTNITLDGVVADDNRRQGCSITTADGVVIKNSTFTNTGGAWPAAGIDIEPAHDGAYANNVQITNSVLNNNFEGMYLSGVPSSVTNVTITGNTMNGNTDSAIGAFSFGTGIVFTDNTLVENKNIDAIRIEGSPATGGIFSNNHIYHTGALYSPTQSGIGVSSTGNTIENNDVHGNYYAAVRQDASGNTVNGNTLNGGPNDPKLSFDPSGLSFGALSTDSISPEQSYILTGSNLLGDVTLTAARGFSISTNSGSGFTASLTFSPISGSVNQTIYVRFKPTEVKEYKGNIYHSSPGINNDIVAVTGSGTVKTGIGSTINNENVIVSPNPFHTSFRVQISSGLPIKNAVIKIYDLNGKEVKTVLINQNETTISRKGMENGIYFYSITNNNSKISNGKLIVQ